MNATSGAPTPERAAPGRAPASDQADDRASVASSGRTAARLARVVENALGQVEISLPQYRMLIFLAESGSEAASALAGKLGVSRPSVTALVDGLVARGWATRCADPADRRRVTHTVTAAGREVLERADEAVERRLRELAEAIPEHDRPAAYAGLEHWLLAMNAEREAKLNDQ